MGEVNCHCHVEGTVGSLQSLAQTCRQKPKPQTHKKTRSRVNSIISPRQIVGLHSRTNSASNLQPLSSKPPPKTIENFSSERIQGLQDLEEGVERNGKTRRYLLQFVYEGRKLEFELSDQVIRFGVVSQKMGVYDEEIVVTKGETMDYGVFGICARWNALMNVLSIKDNGLGMGLGVFQFVKQGQVLDILHDSSHGFQSSFIILDIGIGNFLLLKLLKSKQRYSLEYSQIKKPSNEIPTPTPISRSLPSLYDPYPCEQPQQGQRQILHENDHKTIENRIKLSLYSNKICIESVGGQGFYRYLSEYVSVYPGMRLRCGLGVYGVRVPDMVDKGKDFVYVIKAE